MATRVEVLEPQPMNATVSTAHSYDSQVTLSIENADGSLTPSGWSTRREAGGDGRPFSFQPGKNLIAGWTSGVLQMREGERALIHVPAAEGYGSSPQGTKGGGWYIPGGSNLCVVAASARGRAAWCNPQISQPLDSFPAGSLTFRSSASRGSPPRRTSKREAPGAPLNFSLSKICMPRRYSSLSLLERRLEHVVEVFKVRAEVRIAL